LNNSKSWKQVLNCSLRGDSPVFRLVCAALLGLMTLGGGLGCGSASLEEGAEPHFRTASRAVQSTDSCLVLQRGVGGFVADAKVSNRQPDKRFGQEPVASVSSVNGHLENLLLRFDTGGIPRHAAISSATLTLWQTNSGRPASLRAHAVTSPWQEDSVSWRGLGFAWNAEVAASLEAGPAHPAARSLDISSLVSSWVRQPESNHGLLLAQPEGKTLLDTSESPHPERRPRLEVCFSLAPVGTPPSGTSLLLQVVDAAGNPIPGAAVSSGQALFPTDSSGHLLFEDLPSGRFLARVDALGFTSASVSVELREGAHAGYQARLLPVGEPTPFLAEQGAVIQTPSVRVAIPPNGVVDALGQPVTGQVELTVAPLDPTTQMAAMPGPLEGTRPEGGGVVELESFFMAEVSLWSNGAPVQLAPGASATLEFVLPEALASQFQPGDSVPAWWFDLDAGHWRQEGAGTIQASASQPGKLVWVVEVKHFTWWNCDAPWTDKSCVDVRVVDSEGRPVPDAQVGAQGVTYSGASSTKYTGPEGRACVEIKRGHTADVFGGLRGQPSTALVRVTGTQEAAVCGSGPCTPVTLVMKDVICTPGAYETCPYSGPVDTLGQGLCSEGRRRCNIVGTEWSACQGEVLPALETCQSAFDDDCDGQVNEDCSCSEQEGISCYGGPAGTRGVGVCRGGTVGCDLFGNVACVGQRLPRTEDCSTLQDDDCDGANNECQPVSQWFWTAGGPSCTGEARTLEVALDGEGNTLMVGRIQGTRDFGGTPLTGDWGDLFVAKVNAGGQSLWGQRIDLSDNNWVNDSSIAVDPMGNVLVAGSFRGTLHLAGHTLTTNAAESSVFVAKLSPSGEVLWLQGFAATSTSISASTTSLGGLAIDAAGKVVLTGTFPNGSLRIGGVEHSSNFSYNIFVAKLEGSTGTPLWGRTFGNWDYVSSPDAALDKAGNVLLVASFANTITLDGTLLTAESGPPDIFVTKLDGSTGLALWSQNASQDPSVDLFPSVAIDAQGNVNVLDWLPNTMSFRLVRLDPQGQVLWSRKHGSGTSYLDYETLSMSLDASGNVLVSGAFRDRFDFGGGMRVVPTYWHIPFLAWYDNQGQYLTDTVYPIVVGQWGEPRGYFSWGGSTIDSEGHVVLGGTFSGTVDFGSGPIQSPPCGASPFLMKMDPTP